MKVEDLVRTSTFPGSLLDLLPFGNMPGNHVPMDSEDKWQLHRVLRSNDVGIKHWFSLSYLLFFWGGSAQHVLGSVYTAFNTWGTVFYLLDFAFEKQLKNLYKNWNFNYTSVCFVLLRNFVIDGWYPRLSHQHCIIYVTSNSTLEFCPYSITLK